MSDCMREMTLTEVIEKLPEFHYARRKEWAAIERFVRSPFSLRNLKAAQEALKNDDRIRGKVSR